MKKYKKIISSVIILLVMFSMFISPAYAVTLSGLRNRKQSKINWCWAACAEMLGIYYGNNYTQSNICKYVMGNTDDQSATIHEAGTAIQYATDQNTAIKYWEISEDDVLYELTAGRPFAIRLVWNNGNGHLVVCGGYTAGELRILDPLESNGSSTYYEYDELVNGTQTTGGYGRWHYTIEIE